MKKTTSSISPITRNASVTLSGKLKNLLPELLAALLVSIALLFVFGPIIYAPHKNIFSHRGDGIKTYFIVADHVKNDNSYWHCEGLNYPYGNHTVMSDALPLLSNFIKLISEVVPGIKGFTPALLSLFIVLSYLLCAVVLVKLFRRLGVTAFIAILGSTGLTLLCPQAYRIPYMHGLVPPFYVPLTFLLFIVYLQSDKRKTCNWLNACYTTGVFFIHAYMGLMVALTFGTLNLCHRLKFETRSIFDRQRILAILIQSAIPIAAFVGFMSVSDTAEDRIATPTGLNFMYADLTTIFARAGKHPFDFLQSFLIPDQSAYANKWEGWSYIGLCSTLFIVVLIGGVLRQLIQRKRFRVRGGRLLKTILLSGLILLIVATGFPYTYHPKLFIIADWVPYLRQFRSIGRFAWVFYFGIGIYSLYYLNLYFRYLKIRSYRVGAYVLAGVFLGVLLIEGIDLQLDVRSEIEQTENIFNRKVLDESEEYSFLSTVLNEINPSEYQAIIPLPYFLFGNDIVRLPSNYPPKHLSVAFALRYYTGLPLTAHYGTRPSVSQTIASIQFFTKPWVDKTIRHDFPNQRPFLLFHLNGVDLHPNELAIRRLGDKVYESETITLYRLDWEKVWKDRTAEVFRYFEDKRSEWVMDHEFIIDPAHQPFHYYEGFDTEKKDKSLAGDGALIAPLKSSTKIIDLNQLDYTGDQSLLLTFYLNGEHNRLQADCFLGRETSDGNIEEKIQLNHAMQSFDFYQNYLRCAVEIDPAIIGQNLSLYIRGRNNIGIKIIDELWALEQGASIFRLENTAEGEFLWWNNFPVGNLDDGPD